MCAANDGDMCWKASVDEKQQGEKHVAIHCFHMITRFSREAATNSQSKVRSCSFTVAFFCLLKMARAVFLTNKLESLASLMYDIIVNCVGLTTLRSGLPGTQDGETVGLGGWREWSVEENL